MARDAFHAIGSYHLTKRDLLPLITTYPDDVDLVFNAREH